MSSLSPLPGPQSCFRISNASLTQRSYSNLRLRLPCILWTGVKLSRLKGREQCWWCCVTPEWLHCSFSTAFICSSHLRQYARAVCPTYVDLFEHGQVYLYTPFFLLGSGLVLFLLQRISFNLGPALKTVFIPALPSTRLSWGATSLMYGMHAYDFFSSGTPRVL